MNSNTACDQIAQLDFDPVKVKLMHKESGEGWSLAHATMIEGEYRRFLCLIKLYPNEPMAPLFDVDIFWHYHILDTMKYAADCERVFGYFLHHFPYLGLRGEDDEAAHRRVGARMKALYEATFGGNAASAENAGATAQTAWSMTVAASDGVYATRPSLATMGPAWSMNQAQNEQAHAARPTLPTGITAWSMNQAHDNKRCSVRPTLSTASTAWTMRTAQNRGALLASPLLQRAA